jgi:hypothetical protein
MELSLVGVGAFLTFIYFWRRGRVGAKFAAPLGEYSAIDPLVEHESIMSYNCQRGSTSECVRFGQEMNMNQYTGVNF